MAELEEVVPEHSEVSAMAGAPGNGKAGLTGDPNSVIPVDLMDQERSNLLDRLMDTGRHPRLGKALAVLALSVGLGSGLSGCSSERQRPDFSTITPTEATNGIPEPLLETRIKDLVLIISQLHRTDLLIMQHMQGYEKEGPDWFTRNQSALELLQSEMFKAERMVRNAQSDPNTRGAADKFAGLDAALAVLHESLNDNSAIALSWPMHTSTAEGPASARGFVQAARARAALGDIINALDYDVGALDQGLTAGRVYQMRQSLGTLRAELEPLTGKAARSLSIEDSGALPRLALAAAHSDSVLKYINTDLRFLALSSETSALARELSSLRTTLDDRGAWSLHWGGSQSDDTLDGRAQARRTLAALKKLDKALDGMNEQAASGQGQAEGLQTAGSSHPHGATIYPYWLYRPYYGGYGGGYYGHFDEHAGLRANSQEGSGYRIHGAGTRGSGAPKGTPSSRPGVSRGGFGVGKSPSGT